MTRQLLNIILFACLTVIFACDPASKEKSNYTPKTYSENIEINAPTSSLQTNWYKTSVFYECFVRGFKDSDGDGHGDLQGLINKLDYLKDLGIGGIWLMPIMESQDNDHGYATSDYRNIEDNYGTNEKFKELLNEAHNRGIGIIMDFVINHSAAQHPYFIDASSKKTSDYRKWYVWKDSMPSGWNTFNGNPWRSHRTGYYYAIFWDQMPDWNFKNTSVQAYMKDNLKFWLNMGVDGFRFDAVPYLIENGASEWEHQLETHDYYKELRGNIFDNYNNIFTVCEATGNSSDYLGNGTDEFHSAFAFGLQSSIISAVNSNNPSSLNSILVNYQAPNNSISSIFLANHDYFAGERPFSQLGGNLNKTKLAASTLLTLPGTPFIYYGEEIGISTNSTYSGDWSIRTPMQWTSGSDAGFTTGTPFRNINTNYTTYNVETELSDPASILNHYKSLIAARNSNSALSSGEYHHISTTSTCFSFIKKDTTNTVIVILNFSSSSANATLDLTDTPIANMNLSAGNDLYDPAVTHTNLTTSNYTSYSVNNIPAYGVRIIPFN